MTIASICRAGCAAAALLASMAAQTPEAPMKPEAPAKPESRAARDPDIEELKKLSDARNHEFHELDVALAKDMTAVRKDFEGRNDAAGLKAKIDELSKIHAEKIAAVKKTYDEKIAVLRKRIADHAENRGRGGVAPPKPPAPEKSSLSDEQKKQLKELEEEYRKEMTETQARLRKEVATDGDKAKADRQLQAVKERYNERRRRIMSGEPTPPKPGG